VRRVLEPEFAVLEEFGELAGHPCIVFDHEDVPQWFHRDLLVV
jgi:hypothetical protein